ncbi:MAG TPA: hypothetical protein VIA81_07360 [Acidimicrobiia bacterium]|jgi:hypothetical protein
MTNPQVDREVIVTSNGGNSAGALVAGIIAVLLIALAVWYFGLRDNTADGGAGTDVNVTVEVPTPTDAN